MKYVDETYQYIISTVLFSHYGNINGYLAKIINQADNVNYFALRKEVKHKLHKNYITSDYCSLSNGTTKLTKLAIRKVFEYHIWSIFPQPEQDMSIIDVNYIYAMVGLKIVRSVGTDIANLKFHEYILISREIDQADLNNETRQMVLKLFATPALFFYAIKQRVKFSKMESNELDDTFWTKAYDYLFYYIATSMEKIRNESIANSLHYKLDREMNNLKNRTWLATRLLKVFCNYDNFDQVPKWQVYIYKTFNRYLSGVFLPGRCKKHILPDLQDKYEEQFTETEKIYNEIERIVIEKAIEDGKLVEKINPRATVMIAKPPNSMMGCLQCPTFSTRTNRDVYLLFAINERKKNYFYAFRQENNTLSLLTSSGNERDFAKAVANDSSLKIEVAEVSPALKFRGENYKMFVQRVAEIKTKQFIRGLKAAYYEETVGEKFINFFKSLIPFYSCIQSAKSGDVPGAALSCTLDLVSLVPLIGFSAKYTTQLGNSFVKQISNRYLITNSLARVGSVTKLPINTVLKQITTIAVQTVAKEILTKRFLKDFAVASLRSLDPGCEFFYHISKYGYQKFYEIFQKMLIGFKNIPSARSTRLLVKSMLTNIRGNIKEHRYARLVSQFPRNSNQKLLDFKIVRYFYPGGKHFYGPRCLVSLKTTAELRSVDGNPFRVPVVPEKSTGSTVSYREYTSTGESSDIELELGKDDLLRRVGNLLHFRPLDSMDNKIVRDYSVYYHTIEWMNQVIPENDPRVLNRNFLGNPQGHLADGNFAQFRFGQQSGIPTGFMPRYNVPPVANFEFSGTARGYVPRFNHAQVAGHPLVFSGNLPGDGFPANGNGEFSTIYGGNAGRYNAIPNPIPNANSIPGILPADTAGLSFPNYANLNPNPNPNFNPRILPSDPTRLPFPNYANPNYANPNPNFNPRVLPSDRTIFSFPNYANPNPNPNPNFNPRILPSDPTGLSFPNYANPNPNPNSRFLPADTAGFNFLYHVNAEHSGVLPGNAAGPLSDSLIPNPLSSEGSIISVGNERSVISRTSDWESPISVESNSGLLEKSKMQNAEPENSAITDKRMNLKRPVAPKAIGVNSVIPEKVRKLDLLPERLDIPVTVEEFSFNRDAVAPKAIGANSAIPEKVRKLNSVPEALNIPVTVEELPLKLDAVAPKAIGANSAIPEKVRKLDSLPETPEVPVRVEEKVVDPDAVAGTSRQKVGPIDTSFYISKLGIRQYNNYRKILNKFKKNGLFLLPSNEQSLLRKALNNLALLQLSEEFKFQKAVGELWCIQNTKWESVAKYLKGLKSRRFFFNDITLLTSKPPFEPLGLLGTEIRYQIKFDSPYAFVDLTDFHQEFKNDYVTFNDAIFTVTDTSLTADNKVLNIQMKYDDQPITTRKYLRQQEISSLSKVAKHKSPRMQSIEMAAEVVTEDAPLFTFQSAKELLMNYILKPNSELKLVPTYKQFVNDFVHHMEVLPAYQNWHINRNRYIDDVLFELNLDKTFQLTESEVERGIIELWGPVHPENVNLVFKIYNKIPMVRHIVRFEDYYALYSRWENNLMLKVDGHRRLAVATYRLGIRQCDEKWITKSIKLYGRDTMSEEKLAKWIKDWKSPNKIEHAKLSKFIKFDTKSNMAVEEIKNQLRTSSRKLVLFEIKLKSQAGVVDVGRILNSADPIHVITPQHYFKIDDIYTVEVDGQEVGIIKLVDAEPPLEKIKVLMVNELHNYLSTDTTIYQKKFD